jgi:uncharacterized protein (TIGR02246 family)
MKTLLVLLTALSLPFALPAQTAEKSIKLVLSTQQDAWNRGDVPAFVAFYETDCTFIGKEISHGRDQVLARYKKTYPTPDAMGKLAFTNLNVRLLGTQAAVVTGRFHLDRTTAGGGPANGIFSLVFELQNGKWMIVLDHTSAT